MSGESEPKRMEETKRRSRSRSRSPTRQATRPHPRSDRSRSPLGNRHALDNSPLKEIKETKETKETKPEEDRPRFLLVNFVTNNDPPTVDDDHKHLEDAKDRMMIWLTLGIACRWLTLPLRGVELVEDLKGGQEGDLLPNGRTIQIQKTQFLDSRHDPPFNALSEDNKGLTYSLEATHLSTASIAEKIYTLLYDRIAAQERELKEDPNKPPPSDFGVEPPYRFTDTDDEQDEQDEGDEEQDQGNKDMLRLSFRLRQLARLEDTGHIYVEFVLTIGKYAADQGLEAVSGGGW